MKKIIKMILPSALSLEILNAHVEKVTWAMPHSLLTLNKNIKEK